MRQALLLTTIVGTMLAAIFTPHLPQTRAEPLVQDCTGPGVISLTTHIYIPVAIAPVVSGYPPGTQLLTNGSFESGWTDVTGSIQKANYWTIDWISPGQLLYDETSLMAWADPEFTHKCAWQLPANEQPGQPGALILDGITVYKIFHGASFGGELRQIVSGLPPGLPVQLTVPILLDPHSGTDPWGNASRVQLNGVGDWVWQYQLGNRNWYDHVVTTTVPSNGQLDVHIWVKSKWGGADFFIDDLRLVVINP